jgi:hypothetical protein
VAARTTSNEGAETVAVTGPVPATRLAVGRVHRQGPDPGLVPAPPGGGDDHVPHERPARHVPGAGAVQGAPQVLLVGQGVEHQQVRPPAVGLGHGVDQRGERRPGLLPRRDQLGHRQVPAGLDLTGRPLVVARSGRLARQDVHRRARQVGQQVAHPPRRAGRDHPRRGGVVDARHQAGHPLDHPAVGLPVVRHPRRLALRLSSRKPLRP